MHNPNTQDEKICVLIVDDEEVNLGIMEEHLEWAGYLPIAARSGPEALEIFRANADRIDIILLDRMMPEMDGFEVLKMIKSDERYQHIPVIMQTAAASSAQIVEGIEAGAYYYLTKPYDKQTFLAIVNSAAQYVWQFKSFKKESYKNFLLLDCSVASHFKLCQLEQCNKLAIFLSMMCPVSTQNRRGFSELSYGFSELLINAIEHGNLGISYDGKTELLKSGESAWRDEVARRMALPENQGKYIDVYYMRHDDCVEVTIRDMGKGFNHEPFLEIDPYRSTDNHGRGIAMANVIFDKLIYSNNGNTVTCVIKHFGQTSGQRDDESSSKIAPTRFPATTIAG